MVRELAEELAEMVRELADELAAELDARYAHREHYQTIRDRYERDMDTVYRAWALLEQIRVAS